MDGVYWDSWLVYTAFREHDWSRLQQSFAESGTPWFGFVHQLLGQTPDPVFAYRLIAVGCLLGAALLVYYICCTSGFCNRVESTLIAMTSQLYPAFQVAFEFVLLNYLICVVLFLLGVALTYRSEQSFGKLHYAWRIAALFSFTASFMTKSLLVFYFGFLLSLLLYQRRAKRLSFKHATLDFVTHHADFVLLPFAFWIATLVAFPRSGVYQAYNEFETNIAEIGRQLYNFAQTGIIGALSQGLDALLGNPLILIVSAGAALLLYARISDQFKVTPRYPTRPPALLAFGIVVLPLAILPYALVGKSPALPAWTSRHALLLGLPMAFILVGSARWLWLRTRPPLPFFAFAALSVLVVGFGLALSSNYSAWQVRWIKDRSVMLHLGELEPAPRLSIFWIKDEFGKPGNEFYRYYEWSSLFKTVWGDESRIGFDVDYYKPKGVPNKKYPPRFNLRDFDRKGCQARLTIRKATPFAGAELTARYLRAKFFGARGDLETFLRAAVELHLNTLPAQKGQSCPVLDLTL